MPRKHRRRGRSHWGSNDPAGPGRRRLRFWADLHDGRGYVRHSKTIPGTAQDGWLELDRLHLAHADDRPCPTLRLAYETWYLPELEDGVRSGDVARSTLTNHASRWRRHVEPAFGDLPVSAITPLAIQEWLLDRSKPLAKESLLVLRNVLERCVLYDVLDENVADRRYRLPSGPGSTRSAEVYTLSQTVEALAALRGTVAYVPAILCGLASCRVGESLGPQSGDVSAVDARGMTLAVVEVRRQVDRNGRASDRLKTRRSYRPVVVPEPWSLDVLDAASSGEAWLTDDGLGRPVSQQTLNRVWREALEGAGLSPIPVQNLRNSWRTFMRWELGLPEDLLEAMMGHGGRNVGETHYDRPREDVFARAVADAWVRYRAGESASIGTSWDNGGIN